MAREFEQEEAAQQKMVMRSENRRVKAVVARCMSISLDALTNYCVYGFTGSAAADKALAMYRAEFKDAGMNDNDVRTIAEYRRAVSKRLWDWRHATRARDSLCRQVRTRMADAPMLNAALGIFVGHPHALLSELQDCITRNRGKDDGIVIRAVMAAADIVERMPTHNADTMPTSATRVIIDVSQTDAAKTAASCSYIVHRPKQSPEVHKAA